MADKKHISKFIIGLTAVAVLLCFVAIAYADILTEALGGTGVNMEYETRLFDTDEIIDIDIKMSEDDWNSMLTNAMTEEYSVCDVVVNGQKYYNVAIRPKGNTSLSAIAMDPDTDRYSLKLEFDHFVDGQTCYGLDKLILNNNYADATNMKEAIIYDMYQYLGADASLYNYAKVSVNGEYWGVYLALEAVESSFMLRNFGTQDGELYKPDTMEMGGGDNGSSSSKPSGAGFDASNIDFSNFDFSDVDLSQFKDMTPPTDGADLDMSNMPSDLGDFDMSKMPGGGGGGGFSMGGGGGANLNYSDDDLDSYSTIWDSEITSTGKGDHRRVVTALKNISEGTDLEKYLDIDNILKYMAVHTFAVNMDSLSGSMSHNYYLYEYEGRLNIFPWDYNLSFGGMSMGNSGNATDMVNDAIDTPFSGTKFFDALLENEEYLEIYHSYLQQLTDEYVNGGRFDEVYSRIRSRIDELVATDPTAFYTGDEYEIAAEMLYQTIKLRAESIIGQLNGTIPSTDAGQREDSSSLIDASAIDIKAMGEFSMGGGGFGGFGGSREKGDSDSDSESSSDKSSDKSEEQSSDRDMPSGFPGGFDKDSMPEDFDPNNMPADFGDFDPSNMPSDFGDFDPSSGNKPDMKNFTSGDKSSDSAGDPDSDKAAAADSSSDSKRSGERPSFSGMPGSGSGMPGSGMGFDSTMISNLITYGVCLVIALVALIVINAYKKKR